ncbi:MAG: RDD family protein [Deltaproteobacteria bacterium]|jgi:uncharacterized RDD family membrane protein YckC|nr:RDD family protein [Deltaproteobacteria bacterium]
MSRAGSAAKRRVFGRRPPSWEPAGAGPKKNVFPLLTPEGLPLLLTVAPPLARVRAFLTDLVVIFGSMLLVCLLFFGTDFELRTARSLAALVSFVVLNLYFVYFELAWQGRTPGKKLNGLRVVSRGGGELTPTAVVARNLTRLVEMFLPFALAYLTLSALTRGGGNILKLMLAAALLFQPLLTRQKLRLGDLIGGTMVVSMPKKMLLSDLTETRADSAAGAPGGAFQFTREQLDVYGNKEYLVLEDMLRRADNLPLPPGTEIEGLSVVAGKIAARVGYLPPVPEGRRRQFLLDFYAGLREVLEKRLLFGQLKLSQFSGPPPGQPRTPDRGGAPPAPGQAGPIRGVSPPPPPPPDYARPDTYVAQPGPARPRVPAGPLDATPLPVSGRPDRPGRAGPTTPARPAAPAAPTFRAGPTPAPAAGPGQTHGPPEWPPPGRPAQNQPSDDAGTAAGTAAGTGPPSGRPGPDDTIPVSNKNS